MDRWDIYRYLDDQEREEFEIAYLGGTGRPFGPVGPFNEMELRWELKKLGQSNTQINALIQRARMHTEHRELA